MDDVRLRDVEEPDLEVFFEQQLDPEAARLANFPSRDRERFMTHWTTRVLGDPTVFVQTVTVDGEVAGNVVAWWDRDRRFASERLLEKCGFERSGTVRYGQAEHIMLVLAQPGR